MHLATHPTTTQVSLVDNILDQPTNRVQNMFGVTDMRESYGIFRKHLQTSNYLKPISMNQKKKQPYLGGHSFLHGLEYNLQPTALIS